MTISDTERALNEFEAHYDYDVSYMRYMLTHAPAAYGKFATLTEASAHREAAPVEAAFAAKLVGAVAEDCGPCVQLVADMAREAGVAPEQVEAVLTRDPARMSDNTALGFRFADAVVRAAPHEDEAREAVLAQWGEAGLIDLVLGLQLGRMYPMVKKGLGFGKTCKRIQVGNASIPVVKTVLAIEAA